MIRQWTDNFVLQNTYTLPELREAVIRKLDKTMSKKYGLCREVLDVNIMTVKSSINGHLICTVTITADMLLPTEGQMIHATVLKCMANRGIFCQYENSINILVPYTHIKYPFIKNTFYREDKPILEGDTLIVKITSVRFQNGKYSAIGIINEGDM